MHAFALKSEQQKDRLEDQIEEPSHEGIYLIEHKAARPAINTQAPPEYEALHASEP